MEKIIKFLKIENLIYSVLIFLILTPYIFSSWYFLSLDFSYWPNIDLFFWQYYQNQIVYIYIQKLLSFVIPSFIVQKIFILWFFITALFSINIFLKNIFKQRTIIFLWTILFIINPFVYPRLEQWQFYILYAYSLLPLFLNFLFFKKYILWWIIAALIVSFSPHFIFFVGLIYFLYFIIFIKTFNKNDFKYLFSWLFFIFLLNLYWILNLSQNTNISSFWLVDVEYFSSKSVYFSNIYSEILALNWFWWDNFHRYIIEKNEFKNVYLIFLIFTTIFWFYLTLIKKDKIWYVFFVLILLSFIFSLWISQNNIFYWLNKFLFENMPFYIWLRESNKWSALMVIWYIYFILKTLEFFYEKKDEFVNYSFFVLFLVIIIFNNQSVAMILWKQFVWSNYPNSYFKVQKIMNTSLKECDYKLNNKSTNCYHTLSLPWHQSMSFWFTKKIVSNPVSSFFWKNILFWDNLELWWVYSQSKRQESYIIEKYFWNLWVFTKQNVTIEQKKEFLNDLKWLWINQILLFKEVDYLKYETFLNTLWLQKIDFKEISLYKIKD